MSALRFLARAAAVLVAVCVVFALAMGATLWIAAGPPPPLAADFAVAPSEAPVSNPDLRADLLRRVALDQAVRDDASMPSDLKSASALWALGKMGVRMWRTDQPNQRFVLRLVGASGWPTAGEIGRDGMEALFLIVQHGPLGMQRQALEPFRAAWRAGDLSGGDIALLTDRILMREGRPQIYGTQLNMIAGGEMGLVPIRDAARVDARRAAMGLPPLSDYLDGMCSELQVCVEAPVAS